MAGLCSFIFPGLGQLVAGRPISSIVWFAVVFCSYLLAVMTLGLGLVIAFPLHLFCILHAAHCEREQQRKTMEQALRNSRR